MTRSPDGSVLPRAHPTIRRAPASYLFLLRDPVDLDEAAIATGANGAHTSDFPLLEAEALALIARRPYDIVVWEPVTMDIRSFERAVACCEGSPESILVLRGTIATGLLRLVRQLHTTSARIRISLRPTPLSMDLAAALANTEAAADIPIITGLSRFWPDCAFPELVALASCGSRRASPASAAEVSGCALRTLQWRLRHAGLPPARTLLAWMVTLHTLWRLDVLGWSLKRAAGAAGMPDGRALSEYMARHTAARPRALLRDGGFEAALERSLAALSLR